MDSSAPAKTTYTSKAEPNGPQWSSLIASDMAAKIASLYGVYCGPAAIVWVAAVWNFYKGRPYSYLDRIGDKKLFPDGPRPFTGYIPWFQLNLSDLLKRETQGELQLSDKIYFRYDSIHHNVHTENMPMIVRMPSMSFKNGLHYVTFFHSERSKQKFKFHFQDNGVYKYDVNLSVGLGIITRGNGNLNVFPWGAKQVIAI